MLNKNVAFMHKKYICVLVILLIIGACSKLEGTFAYKTMYMDAYKKMKPGMEFASKSRIDWTFVTDSISKPYTVGVVLLKKEVIWIDVSRDKYFINRENPHIYGHFEQLPAGNYKIVIVTEENELISENPFSIYYEDTIH
jgi:hypothetical protein